MAEPKLTPRRAKSYSLSDEVIEAVKQDWRKAKKLMPNNEADKYAEAHHAENLLRFALETPLEERMKKRVL